MAKTIKENNRVYRPKKLRESYIREKAPDWSFSKTETEVMVKFADSFSKYLKNEPVDKEKSFEVFVKEARGVCLKNGISLDRLFEMYLTLCYDD